MVSDSTNEYIFNFKPCTGKTENGDPYVLRTIQEEKELCSAHVKDPANLKVVYTNRYYTSPLLADVLLGMDIVKTGRLMPSRKEML